jgi:hypothetical protein
MKYQIVVARYNEDVSFLNNYKDITIIYNKGKDDLNHDFNIIKLPNIGRESHTYLYHIINNYDNLADKTIFFQGKIDDHHVLPLNEYFSDDNFTGKKTKHNVDFIKTRIKHFGKYLKDLKSGNLRASKMTPLEWLEECGIYDIKDFELVWGANFSVLKSVILKKPKIFYENLIKYVDKHMNPEEGHYFERSWNIIYNHPNYKIKKTILYSFIDYDIIAKIIDKIKNIKKDNTIEKIHFFTRFKTNIESNNLSILYTDYSNNYFNISPISINNKVIIKFNSINKIHKVHIIIDNYYELIIHINQIKIITLNKSSNDIVINEFINNSLLNIEILKDNNKILININKYGIKLNNDSIKDLDIKNIKIKSLNPSFIEYMSKNNFINLFNWKNEARTIDSFYENMMPDIYKNFYLKNLEKYLIESNIQYD